MCDRDLTDGEKSIIRRLRGIERDWPDTLVLFVWSSTVHVMDRKLYNDAVARGMYGTDDASIETFGLIPASGGDPD